MSFNERLDITLPGLVDGPTAQIITKAVNEFLGEAERSLTPKAAKELACRQFLKSLATKEFIRKDVGDATATERSRLDTNRLDSADSQTSIKMIEKNLREQWESIWL